MQNGTNQPHPGMEGTGQDTKAAGPGQDIISAPCNIKLPPHKVRTAKETLKRGRETPGPKMIYSFSFYLNLHFFTLFHLR